MDALAKGLSTGDSVMTAYNFFLSLFLLLLEAVSILINYLFSALQVLLLCSALSTLGSCRS